MAAIRLAGITNVSINATVYDLTDEIIYKPGTIRRESLMGLNGYHGVKETYEMGYIQFKLRDNAGFEVGDFQGMTDVTVQVQAANGKTVIGTSMHTVDSQEVDAAEGTFSVRFEGINIVEQTA